MNKTVSWLEAPPLLSLAGNSVHVWRVALDQPATTTQALSRVLPPAELARAQRFYFQRHRRRFLVTRGALRLLIARYIAQPAISLKIAYTKYGKPFLPGKELQFNVSHSHELALLAFATERAIGIDVEFLPRRLDKPTEIAGSYFSPAEVAALQSLPGEQRRAAFFNCWTRKEAYIKALGEGLSHPLDSFDVSLRPGEPARFLNIAGDPAETARWALHAFTPASDYVAALAAAGSLADCRFLDFMPDQFL